MNNQNQTITFGNPEGAQFTFDFAENTPQEVIDGVEQAAEKWSSVLKDDVDLNFNFAFEALEDPDDLGATKSNTIPLPYDYVLEALEADASSDNDLIAIDNLPEDESFSLLINNTRENEGSDTPYLDDNDSLNNSTIELTKANAKALGLGIEDLAEAEGVTPEEIVRELNEQFGADIEVNEVDANLQINSTNTWDFNPNDGIALDASDFVGTVVHELGHALGFESNADFLDLFTDPNSVQNLSLSAEDINEATDGLLSDATKIPDGASLDRFISENKYIPTTFDLFRFTPESYEQGARDFTTGNIDSKYFSIDGGQTEIAPLSTGTVTGDGNQLSHWQDELNIGLLAPNIPNGELGQLSGNDLLAFDAIGWDIV